MLVLLLYLRIEGSPLSSTSVRYQLGRSHGMVWFYHTAPWYTGSQKRDVFFFGKWNHHRLQKPWISTSNGRQLCGLYLHPRKISRWKLKKSPTISHRIHVFSIFSDIYHTNPLNVGKYTIHGSYGFVKKKVDPKLHWLWGFNMLIFAWDK